MTSKEKVAQLRELQTREARTSRAWWYLEGAIQGLEEGPEGIHLQYNVVKDRMGRL